MNTLESWVLDYLLNSLWQVPLVFGAAWAAARLVRPAGPEMEHRVWVSALLLETILPGCHLRLSELSGFALRLWSGNASGGETRIAMGPATTHGIGVLRPSAEVLAAVAVAYGCSLLYFAIRLGWGVWKTDVMRRQAESVTLAGETARMWERCRRIFGDGIGGDAAEIAMSPMIAGPVTIGVWRRVLLVPPGFLEGVSVSDLDAVLAHEFAHIRRRDFAKNLFYGVLSLPIAYHPLLWLTRSRLAESREMVCDAMAAEAVAGRESYARSLLRLASMLSDRTPARTLHAIGIFDANIFERRVMNLTQKNAEVRGARRFVIAAACGVIALATAASALALRMNVAAPADDSKAPTRLTRSVSDLTIVSRKTPEYPKQAKKDRLQGMVVLAVTIGKDGAPLDVSVQKSVRGDLDQSALDAVREWRWQPYLLNGDPVEVDTTVSVTYTLEK
jgi:TonB family protein